VLQLRHVLFRSPLFGEIPRQHELGLQTRPGRCDLSVNRCRHPAVHGMK
jgi:hypothetical protein